MNRALDDLFAKRGSTREAALSLIIDDFTVNYRRNFAEKNFATLLYQCLNSMKKGSSKEIVLASRALGLLAITVYSRDKVYELYKESIPILSQALKSKAESLLLSLIECLATVTFVGASDFEQTEASMQIIWHFIHPNPGENVVVKKQTSSVLAAAISAWSLLLTTVDTWNLKHSNWQGKIHFFLDLLQVEDQSVCMAAGEAVALMCEDGFIEKSASKATVDKISSSDEGKRISKQTSLQELQEIISNHAKRFLRQAALQSAATKTVNGWNNFSLNVLEALENGTFKQTAMKIGKHSLQLLYLSKLLQINFIKRLLGRGFVQHMLANEVLFDVFNFSPCERMTGGELYISEREEVIVHLFVPESRQREDEEDLGKTHRATNSAVCKAKTQLLNKKRELKGQELRSYQD